MSLLALLTVGTTDTGGGQGWSPLDLPPLPAVSDAPMPGPFSDTRPFTTYLVPIETSDGSGSTLHPDVIDMVAIFGAPVRGYRYWLSHTPFPWTDGKLENPHLAVSNNGYDWHSTEVGIENPIFPLPPGVGYQSDPDFWWNPEENHFAWTWRQSSASTKIIASTSTDLLTWTEPVEVLPPDARNAEEKSPAVARIAPYQWKVWVVRGPELWRYDATRPHQRWTNAVKCTILDQNGAPMGHDFWHGNVLRLDTGLLIGSWTTGSSAGGGTIAGHSTDDGLTWTFGTTRIFPSGAGRSYRPTLALHEDGEHVRLWDSTAIDGTTYLHVSQVPLTVFTDPT